MGIRFDMIGIFVEDIKIMVDFYKNVVGLEIEWDGEGPHPEMNPGKCDPQ